jgi:hypothetical protein
VFGGSSRCLADADPFRMYSFGSQSGSEQVILNAEALANSLVFYPNDPRVSLQNVLGLVDAGRLGYALTKLFWKSQPGSGSGDNRCGKQRPTPGCRRGRGGIQDRMCVNHSQALSRCRTLMASGEEAATIWVIDGVGEGQRRETC